MGDIAARLKDLKSSREQMDDIIKLVGLHKKLGQKRCVVHNTNELKEFFSQCVVLLAFWKTPAILVNLGRELDNVHDEDWEVGYICPYRINCDFPVQDDTHRQYLSICISWN